MTPHPLVLDIPNILRQAELKPSKGLGQNFLSDGNILQKIVDEAGLTKQDRVLEIGPGLGSLTLFLAEKAATVIAVELDRKLFPILTHHLRNNPNVHLVQGDILKLDPAGLMQQSGYQVVANIPYYITSAVIRHLLESDCKPASLVLTVQHEVAQRACALPGRMNLLALSIQVYGQPQILFKIPAGAFYPPPKVDSAVLRIKLNRDPLIPSNKLDLFFKMIKAGFSQKRKTLRNSLSGGLHITPQASDDLLRTSGIDPKRRAESLSLQEWQYLINNYQEETAPE